MGEIKIRGLSLAQEKAANLIATGGMISDTEIANSLGIKKTMLTQWKKDPKFKVRVLQIFDMHVDFEKTNRVKRVAKILKPIYREITARLKDPEFLEQTSFKELLRIMSQLHSELRSDGAINKKFLDEGLSQMGSESNEEFEDYEVSGMVGDEMASMSSMYEQERANAIGKKVVNIR